jgi:AraC family transcriptional regulator, regulatory protein of adaptative response / methylated-DNA-[protein]-cysteine methyltransferase
MALTGVREGKNMLDLHLDQGFESSSGFREAFAKVFGTAPSLARDVDCLFAKWFETPLGPMLALANDAGLYLLEFVDRRGLEREVQALRRRLTQHVVPGEHRHLDQIGEELDAYFAGRSLIFTTPLQLAGSPFQRAVWKTLLAIPPGETLSYADVAVNIARPAAVRAVGRANGNNKLTIIVPCHRVIGADGTLTGYGGGLWRKAWLLEHERTFTHARGQLALVSTLPAAAAA